MLVPLATINEIGPNYVDLTLNSNSPYGVTCSLVSNTNGQTMRPILSSDSPVHNYRFRIPVTEKEKLFEHLVCKQVPNG